MYFRRRQTSILHVEMREAAAEQIRLSDGAGQALCDDRAKVNIWMLILKKQKQNRAERKLWIF